MSNTSKEGFEMLGLNADKMFKMFAQGGEQAQEAYGMVAEKLLELEDPLKKMLQE